MRISRVMVIDDEADLREMVALVLQAMAGWEVSSVASCAEALATGPSAAPEAILLDVNMPGVDGPGTLQAIRATAWGRSTPIVFLTAHDAPAEHARLRALGARGVLKKPFDPMTLAEQVQAVLDG